MAEQQADERAPRGLPPWVTATSGLAAARRPWRRRAATLLSLALVAIVLVGAGVTFYGYRALTQSGPLASEARVVVPSGTGVRQIGTLLADKGIIRNRTVFLVGARLLASDRPLKAGEFAFPARISALGALRLLQNGKTVVRSITVPEGLTTAQVLALVAGAEGLTGALPAVDGEGKLLPETYHYSWGDSGADMIARMGESMRITVAELWPERAEGLPLDSPEQAVALASIVERETARDDERPRVAAVFLNRLRQGMKLQSDPTVAYALTEGKAPLGRPLARADLAIEHPYNTYVIDGIPPGPIANPGRASIEAVLHPLATDDLYFVADGNGGHAFATTLEEHLENVARWRRSQRE